MRVVSVLPVYSLDLQIAMHVTAMRCPLNIATKLCVAGSRARAKLSPLATNTDGRTKGVTEGTEVYQGNSKWGRIEVERKGNPLQLRGGHLIV